MASWVSDKWDHAEKLEHYRDLLSELSTLLQVRSTYSHEALIRQRIDERTDELAQQLFGGK